jgi:hypothetical protein
VWQSIWILGFSLNDTFTEHNKNFLKLKHFYIIWIQVNIQEQIPTENRANW